MLGEVVEIDAERDMLTNAVPETHEIADFSESGRAAPEREGRLEETFGTDLVDEESIFDVDDPVDDAVDK